MLGNIIVNFLDGNKAVFVFVRFSTQCIQKIIGEETMLLFSKRVAGLPAGGSRQCNHFLGGQTNVFHLEQCGPGALCQHFRCPGGHTARPELTVDLITLGALVVAELPGRVADRVAHLDPNLASDGPLVKLVFGAIHAGDAANVIPTNCTLKASIRTPSLRVWDELPSVVEDELRAMVEGTGATLDIDYTHGVPPVVNDTTITELVEDATVATFGAESLEPVQQSWGGDDFAWFTREVPGTYVRLGVRTPNSPTLDLHAGHFDVDERAIGIGVRLLTATVDRYFAGRAAPTES